MAPEHQCANAGKAMVIDGFTIGPDGLAGTSDDIAYRQAN